MGGGMTRGCSLSRRLLGSVSDAIFGRLDCGLGGPGGLVICVGNLNGFCSEGGGTRSAVGGVGCMLRRPGNFLGLSGVGDGLGSLRFLVSGCGRFCGRGRRFAGTGGSGAGG